MGTKEDDALRSIKWLANELEAESPDASAILRMALEDLSPAPKPALPVHPLAAFDGGLGAGLYRIHWQGGGTSLCAIGMRVDGTRWLAPVNWVEPSKSPRIEEWAKIEKAELLFVHPEAALSVSPSEEKTK